MIIKNIKLNNFQLFESVFINFEKINIISGKNFDSPNESGNGAGKSTLCLSAILFGLYGYCPEGIVIKDLLRFSKKEASIEIECSINDEHYKIIRKIPSELQIFLNDKEIQANTLTIKQKFIDEKFGDVNFFRQYRCCDLKNGINVLDLGIVSLRKTLMGFIEGIFTDIRNKLLAQKVERERYSIDKKLCKHYLSTKRQDILKNGLNNLMNIKKDLQNQKTETQNSLNKVNGDINSKKRIIDYKKNETAKAKEGICPILRTKCEKISKSLTDKDSQTNLVLSQEINNIQQEIEQLQQSIEGDNEYLNDLQNQMNNIDFKIERIRRKSMRLESAFQFKDYKYTKTDIIIYDEAIKVLDTFAGEYIKEWLSSLSIILNNLLNKLNIRIEFSADKDFIRVFDNEQILKYDQLSQGQKCFLNVIFKLAILLQQNKEGLLLCDDGLGSIDSINLTNLLNICNTLPFQIIGVYQNYINELENVKQIIVIRKNNESKIE